MKAQLLLVGAILASRTRTVTSALRVIGLRAYIKMIHWEPAA